MHLSYLQEFVILAKYMSISKASRELNMTQSNLSKHIQQLEREMGVSLISHRNKLEFTPAGLYFLDQIGNFINLFTDIVEKCKDIERMAIDPLIIRQSTFNDAGTMAFYRILDSYRSLYPYVPVRFTLARYASPLTMIDAASVDVLVVYEYGDISDIINNYAGKGFFAYPLCSESFGAWVPNNHPLANRQVIDVDDLKGISILESNQIFAPLAKAITSLCEANGFTATFEYRTVQSFAEMITCHSPTAIHLFPLSIKDDPQLTMNSEMRFIPVGKPGYIQTMLLMSASPEGKKAVTLLAKMLKESLSE